MNTTPLYTDTISSLRECYDTHSEKFSSTRKKHRPELAYVIDQLKTQGNNLDIIELGCGDGRLYQAISQYNPRIIHNYDGIDISQGLLDKANQILSYDHHTTQRHHTDMIDYLAHRADQSADTIICMASFQHLPDRQSRDRVLAHIYRVLRYGGSFITIDRSWSSWMIHKHHQPILHSLKKTIQTFGHHERNNLIIPFTHHGLRHERLYHIFTCRELKHLITRHGFIIQDQRYSSQDGSFHHDILQARNICTIAKKEVFV